MAHNIMVKATPLPNIRGRVGYIRSKKKQENLVAVFSSTNDRTFWKGLSDHCQEQAKYSRYEKACEGREFMVMLANEISEIRDGQQLAKDISEVLKELTGTENIVAIHWNQKKNNYHAHVVVAENKEINLVKKGAVLTQNTYYNSEGKRARKKECIDADGQLLPGCSFVPKGSCKEDFIRFGPKVEGLSSKEFLRTVKESLADLQNEYLQEDRFVLYKDDGIHIRQQHEGKKLKDRKKTAVEEKNDLIRDYNRTADEILEAAAKIDEKTLQKATDDLKFIRRDIKKYALRTSWMESIRFYLEQMKGNLKVLQKRAGEKKVPLMAMVQAAAARREHALAADQKAHEKTGTGNSSNDDKINR